MPLVVVQKKIPAGRGCEICQTTANRASAFGMRIGVGHINLSAARNSRRANGDFPTVQSRSIDGQREEDVRIADRIVIEIVTGALMIVVQVERPPAQRDGEPKLVLLVALSSERNEAKSLFW